MTEKMVSIESEFVKGMVETIGELRDLKAEMLATLQAVANAHAYTGWVDNEIIEQVEQTIENVNNLKS